MRSTVRPVSHGHVTRVVESGGVRLTEARYAPGFRIPRHEHDLAGFTYVARGSSVEALRSRSLNCVTGSVVIKPPDAPHTNAYGLGGATCLLVEFRPWRYDLIREHTAAFERVALCPGGPQSAIARRLHGELWRPLNDVSSLIVEALVLEVAGEASRPTRSARGTPAWLEDVRDFLHDDFRVIRRVSQVADVAGVHPVHLARVFRATFGCSIGSYVRRLRLESAAADLARSSRPIGAIALDAGFSDQSHFTHAFTAFFGRSPGVYRKENGLPRVSGRPGAQPPQTLDPDKAR